MKVTPYIDVELELLRNHLTRRVAVGADTSALAMATAIALGQLAVMVSDPEGLKQAASDLLRIVQANALANAPTAGSS